MPLRVERAQNLECAILQNKISEIEKFNEVIREINLNADRKRSWLGRIESVEDKRHNDSFPISLSQFRKEEI